MLLIPEGIYIKIDMGVTSALSPRSIHSKRSCQFSKLRFRNWLSFSTVPEKRYNELTENNLLYNPIKKSKPIYMTTALWIQECKHNIS